MPRKVPERTPEQQKEEERSRALRSLDVPAIRAWLERYGVGALGDDALVLRAAHETRAVDPKMPRYVQRESVRWLRAHYPESETLKTLATCPGEFHGKR